MKEKNGQTLPSREQHSSFFIFLTSLLQPSPRLCPGLNLLCSSTVLSHRRSSSPGFINACCHPVAKKKKNRDGTTEDINLLIWPWWHAYSTHSPPRSSLPILSYSLRRLERSSLSHTLYFWACCCMQYVFSTLHLCAAPIVLPRLLASQRPSLWASARTRSRFPRRLLVDKRTVC